MKADYQTIVEELKDVLSKRFKEFLGIHVFGSRVKGNFNDDSDLDIVILLNSFDRKDKFEIYGILSFLEYKYDVFLDCKILTPERLKYNPFFYEQVINFGQYYGV